MYRPDAILTEWPNISGNDMGIKINLSQIIDTVNITVLLVIALYHCLLYLGRKQYSSEKYNLYFSLSLTSAALSSFAISEFFQLVKITVFHNVPVPPLFAGIFLACAYYFFVPLLANLLGMDKINGKLLYTTFVTVGVAALMPLCYLCKLITFQWYMKYLFLPVILLFTGSSLSVIIYFVNWMVTRKLYQDKTIRLFSFGLFSLVLYFIVDNLLNIFIPNYFSTYFNSFIGVFAVLFSYALSLKFNDEYNELVRLKSDLEHAVDLRTLELLESKNKIKALSEQRIDYFINLAHEIRTPLTLIKNYLDKYYDAMGAPRDIQIVKKNVDKLCHDMINFLDSEKLERGQVFYNHELITPFSGLLNEKISQYRDIARGQGIALTSQITPALFITADPTAVDRILNNLLDNAIKYTEKGGTVEVSLWNQGDSVQLVVKDSGIGISLEQQENIFRPYYQITHKKRNYQGMGIGLTIVKQIMDSLHGAITIDSALNHGAQFLLTFKRCHSLPADESSTTVSLAAPQVQEQASNRPAPVSSGAKPAILIVEDNVDMLNFLAEELAESYRIETADNGRSALKKVEQMAPDMILSDVMMDEMDGYELFKAVAANERFRTIPFLFITAKSSQLEKIARLSEGALDYINKPFDMNELKARVDTILRYRAQQKNIGMQAAIDLLHGHLNSPDQLESSKWKFFDAQCRKYKITEREQQIIKLVSDGQEYKEIAVQLYISIKTVNRHIQNIYEKTAVSNKIELLKLLFESAHVGGKM